MRAEPNQEIAPVYLGIECGGTRTVALSQGAQLQRQEFPAANLRLITDAQLVRHLRAIARAMPAPTALAIGMAGARTPADRGRIRRAAAAVWRQIPCYATNDLETALMAADMGLTPGGRRSIRTAPRRR